MVKKCIYCKCDVAEESVIDFCERCGKGVWGEKMFNAIIQNMKEAKENGDLVYSEKAKEPMRELSNSDEFGQHF